MTGSEAIPVTCVRRALDVIAGLGQLWRKTRKYSTTNTTNQPNPTKQPAIKTIHTKAAIPCKSCRDLLLLFLLLLQLPLTSMYCSREPQGLLFAASLHSGVPQGDGADFLFLSSFPFSEA
ncbi:uncharacterized protein LOC126984173 [Eriocheir sinensis]|uniref:uncharacterized protein LOC126984173 n=1 Tax=Eriocheir sinensis TaxID=95602 RepID=UPI0021CACA5B|nr:uncharacterized protein LOC126984173 [Eriocheir sinensis]